MPTIEKQGYKYTEEFGYIPEDWDLIALEDITTKDGLVRGPFGGALKKECFVNNGYKVYEQGNAIYQTIDLGTYYINEEKFKELKRFEVKSGDYIVSCSGTIGKIFRLPLCIPKGVINQALLKITLDESKMNADFFLIVFNCSKFQSSIIDSTQGGAMKNLVGMPIFKQSKILCPSLPEQEKIAEVLGDVDSLIDKTQQLINKKKDLKTATMQKLLTPKEDWVEKKLSDISTFINGLSYESNICENGRYNLITLDSIDIQGKLKKSHKKVDNINKFLPKGSLVMILSDVAHGYFLGLTDVIPEDNKYVLNQRVGGLISVREIIPRLLSLIINVNQDYFRICGQGSSQKNLSKDSIENFVFRFPKEYSEQERITTTLSNMDSEIEALEKELNKYKDLKTGMMQQLLTGKVRLI